MTDCFQMTRSASIAKHSLALLEQSERVLSIGPKETGLHLAITAEEEMAKAFYVFIEDNGFNLSKFEWYKHRPKQELISELYISLAMAEAELDYALSFSSGIDDEGLRKLKQMTELLLNKREDLRQGIYATVEGRLGEIPDVSIEEFIEDATKRLRKIATVIESPLTLEDPKDVKD